MPRVAQALNLMAAVKTPLPARRVLKATPPRENPPIKEKPKGQRPMRAIRQNALCHPKRNNAKAAPQGGLFIAPLGPRNHHPVHQQAGHAGG